MVIDVLEGRSWIRVLQLGEPMSSFNHIRILIIHNDPVAQTGLSVAFGKHSDLGKSAVRWSGAFDAICS